MYHFCTLFDRNYLFKGLALYESLERVCPHFELSILCMDNETHSLLRQLELPRARLIPFREFEDPELRVAKAQRSALEFFWTCTPSLPLYLLKTRPDIDLITYLDADLLFFSSPAAVFDEFDGASILVIEHRFPPALRCLEVNGKYNVQMLAFRRDASGLQCLQWWREKCLEWCYYRLEDGKIGDQKYLDEWPERFDRVHVLQHLGAGVAPWNVSQYRISERGGHIFVNEDPLIFYHFHQFQIFNRQRFFWASRMYCAGSALPKAVYQRYIEQIRHAIDRVHKVDPAFRYGFSAARRTWVRELGRRWIPHPIRQQLRRFGL